MQKIQFHCLDCDAEGTVRLPDECDDYSIDYCPCCGSPLPPDDEDDE